MANLSSIIKCECDNSVLVWKHPDEDFNLGSELIVHESQEAVFFKDGQALDLFPAGRFTLETEKLPLLNRIFRIGTDPKKSFHSEVYFINLTTQTGIKWGTNSKIRMFDPASGLHVELGASGEFSIRVVDSRKLLLKLVGTTNGMRNDTLLGSAGGANYFRAMIMALVKSYLASTIKEQSISVLEIDEKLAELSDGLKARLNAELTDYGLVMPSFYVVDVVTPDDDPNYVKLRQQFAERTLRLRQAEIEKAAVEAEAQARYAKAEVEARLREIEAAGSANAARISGLAEADVYKMKAAAEAEEMRLKGYTYQQETSRMVGMEAMKNGLAGSADGSSIGNIAGLGVTLGAMGGVINMTKDAMNPVLGSTQEMTKTVADTLNSVQTSVWTCPTCGKVGNTGNFCDNCGTKRP